MIKVVFLGRLVLTPVSSNEDSDYLDLSPAHRAIQTLAKTSPLGGPFTRNISFREKKLILLSAETNPLALNLSPSKNSVLYTILAQNIIEDLIRGDVRLHLSKERAGNMPESQYRILLPSFLCKCELDSEVISPVSDREIVGKLTVLSEYNSPINEAKVSPNMLDWRITCKDIESMTLPIYGPKYNIQPSEPSSRIAVFTKITNSVMENVFYLQVCFVTHDEQVDYPDSSPEFRCSNAIPLAIFWGHSKSDLSKHEDAEPLLPDKSIIEDSNSESGIVVLATSGSYKSESDIIVLGTSGNVTEDEPMDVMSKSESEVSTIDDASFSSPSNLHCSIGEFLADAEYTERLVDISPFYPGLIFQRQN